MIGVPSIDVFPQRCSWIVVCVIGIWFTSQVGYARLLARYASLTGNAAAADKALQISPLDAQVHSARATVFYRDNLRCRSRE